MRPPCLRELPVEGGGRRFAEQRLVLHSETAEQPEAVVRRAPRHGCRLRHRLMQCPPVQTDMAASPAVELDAPRLAAASAALVRSEIARRSSSTTIAMMPT